MNHNLCFKDKRFFQFLILQTTTSSTQVQQTPQPTDPGGQPGGVGVRSSNVTIAWIAISVTVGVSILIAVSVVVLLAVAYSHTKGRVLRKKRKTGEGAKVFTIVIPQLIIASTVEVFSLLNRGGMLNGCVFDKWIIGLILCAAVLVCPCRKPVLWPHQ